MTINMRQKNSCAGKRMSWSKKTDRREHREEKGTTAPKSRAQGKGTSCSISNARFRLERSRKPGQHQSLNNRLCLGLPQPLIDLER